MDYLHDFDTELAKVFATCQTRIDSYPAKFQPDARRRLDKLNILKQDYNGNCLSQLLPFWLQPVFVISPDICREICGGNIFGFLYFLIQDAVMDTIPGEYKADLLPLGNLFFLDFMEKYRHLFPTDPVFWSYFRKYFEEWAESVAAERQGYWDRQTEHGRANLEHLARKAAPLKITIAAICLLKDHEEFIAPLAQAVDTTVITFQLLDDWNDWREDLAIGNCSYFLAQVMQVCGVVRIQELDEAHIQKAVYGFDLLNEIFAIAETNLTLVTETKPQTAYLIQYHQSLNRTFQSVLQAVQEGKNAVIQGGFFNFLYQQKKIY